MRHDPILFCAFSMFYALVTSFPINKCDQNNKPNTKNEIRLPNGTIIGKYSYLDLEGNPINVKYYADNTSYGVELNSVKIIDATQKLPLKIRNTDDMTNEPQPKVMSDLINTHNVMKSDYEDPFESLNKDAGKMNNGKVDKTNSDYEIYYQKELKDSPGNCHNNKIKIYYDIEKRRTRDAINNYGDSQYCDQF